MADSDTTLDPGTWRQKSAGLFMRTDATEAGKMVRLADVVRWLMHAGDLPIVPAVKALCEKLTSLDPAPQLYGAREADWALPLRPDNAFGYFTDESLSTANRLVQSIAAGNVDPMHPVKLSERARSEFSVKGVAPVTRETAPDLLKKLDSIRVVQPGLPAAVRYMDEHWAIGVGWWWYFSGCPAIGERALDDSKLSTYNLCMSLQDAITHFGFGMRVQAASPFPLADWPALVAYRKAHVGSSWADGNQIAIGKARFEALGGNEPNQKTKTLIGMATDLGVSRQVLERALFSERKRVAKAQRASALPTPATAKRNAG